MPTIHVSKTEFEKYVGKKLPEEELKDRISYLGTDLEGIEDGMITVEVFPNRPDMLSIQGFARAFSSFIGKKTGLIEYTTEKPTSKVIIDSSVEQVRPFTTCALVRGLKLNDERIKEIIDMQEKLHITYGRNRKKVAIGIYPLEAITLPITYRAKNPQDIVFQPLESEKEMNAVQILEEHPTGQKYGHLLEGQSVFPVFEDANGDVLSVPPIINSHKTGRVTEQTTEVFVECSGHEFELLEKALNMLVTALADMGGVVEQMTLEYGDGNKVTPDLSPSEMKVDLQFVNKLLGLELTKKEAAKLLEKMGYGIKEDTVLIPAYRADILHQSDLGEDIAIAYGYDNFEAVIPKVATVAHEAPIEALKEKIAQLLVGLSYQEACTYALTNKEDQLTKMEAKKTIIELANAISLEYNVLRGWMLPTIIDVFANNMHNEYPQSVFSFGTVFSKDASTETGTAEAQWLGVGSCHEKADYTQIRQVIEYILRSIGVSYDIKEFDAPYYLDGRSAQVLVNKKIIGTFGEVSPQVLSNWELPMPAVIGELNVDALLKAISE